MPKRNKKRFIELITEFAKLQLAGNIPFWGTYLGFMFFDKVMHLEELTGLAIATVASNIVFFIVDDKWVFTSKRGSQSQRKGRSEILKFVIFMSFNALLSLVLTHSWSEFLGITPYIGQFITGGVLTLWIFAGLRFWVFSPPHHHGLFPPKRRLDKRRRA